MTDHVTDGTDATIDGSGSPVAATGPINLTFSGTLGPRGKRPTLEIFARADGAAYAPLLHRNRFGTERLELNTGDDWYWIINTNGATVDLSSSEV